MSSTDFFPHAKRQPKTLLESFIEAKAKSYEEPRRRGTPKGEPIGLGRIKHYASLLMLTNRPQKAIADQVRVSYGLLRKWNTEKAFRDMVQQHCHEFCESLPRYIEERLLAAADNLSGHFEEGTVRSQLKDIDRAFSDSQDYGHCVLTCISDWIHQSIASLSTRKTPREIDVALAVQNFLIERFFVADKSYARVKKQVLQSLLQRSLRSLNEIHQKSLTGEALGEARFIVSLVENYIRGFC